MPAADQPWWNKHSNCLALDEGFSMSIFFLVTENWILLPPSPPVPPPGPRPAEEHHLQGPKRTQWQPVISTVEKLNLFNSAGEHINISAISLNIRFFSP